MTSTATMPLPATELYIPESNALWYKDAIIYQLHVRAYRDSNADGVGDFRGLTETLDYIQELGVTGIWLLPFFPSPLKDDGYDISDYRDVNPQYGSLRDFQALLEEAHHRELKVITELVMNHTSDQHEWFQRSRRAKPGTEWRDWYVWSDTPEKYPEARIIFQDFETSNWTWDPVAGAYFWHRFYSHQPDLNFDNPEVRREMIDTVDYWLEMGVDGLRLDAVPYLYEREGTNCENLPETHKFLRDLRRHIEDKFTGKMLLAEANQWPEDAAAYFGDGDECHMNFHFPLMPRLFMAVEREDRSPIIDILEQTPILPQTAQWAIFLRNHDELTLEMVTDEERDYMYRAYAVDSKARINLGIRRRLAPLMGNSRRKIELMNGLLLSLPGTPIIYYGDEIGMGDNFYLGDRNGVRTPMQWNSDRNSGFSRANPQSLYLPVIIDPEYHFELRNVEVQQASPHSLLWWMRRILDIRKQHHAFGHGSFEPLISRNSKVFAFIRETDEETLLVVANLSRFSQFVELDLSRFRGRTPTELFGQTAFPAVGEHPYALSLGPHGFYWFCIGCRESDISPTSAADLSKVQVRGPLENIFKGRARLMLREALEPYLRRHRWFAGKARTIQSVELVDWFDIGESAEGEPRLQLMLAHVQYAEGEPDAYVLPLMWAEEDLADNLMADHPQAGILRVELPDQRETLTLCESVWQHALWHRLLDAIHETPRLIGQHGTLTGIRTRAFAELWDDALAQLTPSVHGGEQSNTSATFDERLMLKLFRRVTPGVNPDFEIGLHLTDEAMLEHVPKVAGTIEYRKPNGQQMTVAILHQFVSNVGDAWTYTLDELSRYFERVQSRVPETALVGSTPAGFHETGSASHASHAIRNADTAIAEQSLHGEINDGSPPPTGSVFDVITTDPPESAQEMVGAYLLSAELLGKRTGELHLALANDGGNPAFTPEPFTRLYQRGLYQSMRTQTRGTMELLRTQLSGLDDEAQRVAVRVIESESLILDRLSHLLHDRIDAQRIRCHGDYHLGQVLFTGKDFVIIDFEGEPARPVSERRIKTSPLRDVAGMLRSLHYASHAALLGHTPALLVGAAARSMAEKWAEFWYAWTAGSFLRAYLDSACQGTFLPHERSQFRTLLVAYLLEKALYELRYELNNRPDWVKIPLEGIRRLLE